MEYLEVFLRSADTPFAGHFLSPPTRYRFSLCLNLINIFICLWEGHRFLSLLFSRWALAPVAGVCGWSVDLACGLPDGKMDRPRDQFKYKYTSP